MESPEEICRNKDVAALSSDKDTSTIIMNRSDYVVKVDCTIEVGVNKRKYAPAEDTYFRKSEDISIIFIQKL